VILVILIALVLCGTQERHDQHETFSSHNEAIRTGLWHGKTDVASYELIWTSTGTKLCRYHCSKGVAKADLILSEDGVFLSYSVLVKQNDKPIESMHFAIDDKVVNRFLVLAASLR